MLLSGTAGSTSALTTTDNEFGHVHNRPNQGVTVEVVTLLSDVSETSPFVQMDQLDK